MNMHLHSLVGVILCLALVSTGARSQCGSQWQPGSGIPGTDGEVFATTMWDPDGPGPRTPVLVIAGSFSLVADLAAANIVAWDPVTGAFSTFGSGVTGTYLHRVDAVAALPNGDLVAAGWFDQAGGVPVNYIARWDGVAWHKMGLGLDLAPAHLTVLPNGDLVVGGDFLTAGGVPALGLARWNGTAWSAIGGGAQSVRALAAMPNGDLVVSAFNIFGVAGTNIARWNGAMWSPLGAGLVWPARALTLLPNGDLVAAGPLPDVMRWDGVVWSPLGTASFSVGDAVTTLPNGDLLAAAVDGVWRWDGAAWTPYPFNSFVKVRSITPLPNGDFAVAGGVSGNLAYIGGIERWDGTAYVPLHKVDAWSVVDGGVVAMAVLADGNLMIAGAFRSVGGAPIEYIAQWSNGAFAAVGNGLPGRVSALAALPTGSLCAACRDPSGYVFVERWDGTVWSLIAQVWPVATFPVLVAPDVNTMLALPNGDLVVGGRFGLIGNAFAENIARWNGVTWSPLGYGVNGKTRALAAMPNGDLIVGGELAYAGGAPVINIARWNGVAWSPLGPGLGGPSWPSSGSVACLAVLSNGDLIAGGSFQYSGTVPIDHVARWDGSSWLPIGSGTDGTVVSLYELPNGDLVAAGGFTTAGGVPANGVARWDGVAWSSMQAPVTGAVISLVMSPSGELLVGGTFTAPLPFPARLARLASTCPATSAVSGLGCASSGGANTLLAATLPWAESTFTAIGTNLPATAIVVALTSETAIPQGAVPLAAYFAQGLPGCDVLVAPDIAQLLLTTNGTVRSSLFLPNTPPLVGLTFFHQMVPVELDQAGNFVAITATNALQLTVGEF